MNNSHSIRNTLARLINPIIDELNEAIRMPKYVIMVPDWDILRGMKNLDFGVTYMSGRSIVWLCSELEKLFDARRQDLYAKTKGSILSDEPYIIWVKAIKRPRRCDAMAVRHKFNDAMNNTIAHYRNNHIMNVRVDQNLFDLSNNLLPAGKIQFWCELNAQMKSFHKGEMDLKPLI